MRLAMLQNKYQLALQQLGSLQEQYLAIHKEYNYINAMLGGIVEGSQKVEQGKRLAKMKSLDVDIAKCKGRISALERDIYQENMRIARKRAQCYKKRQ